MELDKIITDTSQGSSGFGAQFKNARTEKGASLDEVAAELNILKRHLDAIERNDFDSLPQMAFTKGFVSSYAKYLKLDVKNVLAHFESIYPKNSSNANQEIIKPIKVDKKLGKVTRNNKKTSFGRFGFLLAILGLGGIVFLYFNSIKKSDVVSDDDNRQTVIEQIDQSQTDISFNENETTANITESTDNLEEANIQTQVEPANDANAGNNVQDESAVSANANQVAATDGYISYKVKRGDGLIALAKKNGISPSQLAAANNMKPTQNLLLGQTIKIPSKQE